MTKKKERTTTHSLFFSFSLFQVAASIVLADTVRRRAKMIVHHLGVCAELRDGKLQNYHILAAILAGLGNASVSRLRHTWEAVPRRWRAQHEELLELCSAVGSYSKLRHALLEGDPPKIPYLAQYLSDLTFIEDGNPDNVKRQRAGGEEVELIFMSKRALLYKVLSAIKTWQQVPYNLSSVDSVQHVINNMVAIDEKSLYSESLLREPRDCDRNQIK